MAASDVVVNTYVLNKDYKNNDKLIEMKQKNPWHIPTHFSTKNNLPTNEQEWLDNIHISNFYYNGTFYPMFNTPVKKDAPDKDVYFLNLEESHILFTLMNLFKEDDSKDAGKIYKVLIDNVKNLDSKSPLYLKEEK